MYFLCGCKNDIRQAASAAERKGTSDPAGKPAGSDVPEMLSMEDLIY
jgi:hypothetical protein